MHGQTKLKFLHATDPSDVVLDNLDEDSPFDNNPDNNGGGQPSSPADDAVDGDGNGAVGGGDPATDQDNADPALVEVLDLALIKQLDSAAVDFPYTYGDTLKFQIELGSQGNVPIDSLSVTDYLPVGFEFITDLNPGWDGTNPVMPVYGWAGDTLFNGDRDTICLYTRLVMAMPASDSAYTNVSEISFAQDTAGNDRSLDDIDSNLDNNPFNNGGSLPDTDADDYLDGDAKGNMNMTPDGVDTSDQDNVDPFRLIMPDYALIKTADLQATPGPFGYGDSIKFEIIVFNQGNVISDDMTVTEYIPDGYAFDPSVATNSIWNVVDDSTLNTVITDDLVPNASDTLCLTLTFQPALGFDAWTNVAEISEVFDTSGSIVVDVDSPLNDEPDDNAGGGSDTPADDELDGDGTGMVGDGVDSTDQDNADPDRQEVVDLALIKLIDSSLTNLPLMFDSLVKFQIVVQNQGNVIMDSVVVADYVPAGFGFDETIPENAALGWRSDATATIPGPINPQEYDTICVYHVLQSVADPMADSWVYYAEILAAYDTAGVDRGGEMIWILNLARMTQENEMLCLMIQETTTL